jgi:3-oxoadipate enol-lactonase
MVGDEDVSTPKALADRIVGAIPRAKLMVIPGAGHGSTLEQPAIVTAAIGAFLDAQSEERMAAPHSAAAA